MYQLNKMLLLCHFVTFISIQIQTHYLHFLLHVS